MSFGTSERQSRSGDQTALVISCHSPFMNERLTRHRAHEVVQAYAAHTNIYDLSWTTSMADCPRGSLTEAESDSPDDWQIMSEGSALQAAS